MLMQQSQEKVLTVVRAIPRGETRSYGAVALHKQEVRVPIVLLVLF